MRDRVDVSGAHPEIQEFPQAAFRAAEGTVSADDLKTAFRRNSLADWPVLMSAT